MLSGAAAEEVGMLDTSSNPGKSKAITAKAAASLGIFLSNRHPSLFRQSCAPTKTGIFEEVLHSIITWDNEKL
jgi:hypothetical protein